MFKNIPPAAPDAIFGLAEAVGRDPRPDKVDLGAGVYKDEDGQTPVFAAVKEAERLIWEREPSKSYLPIEGGEEFARCVQQLLGDDHEIRAEGRVATLHTPGGTGALRVMADFLAANRGDTTVWMSDRTWPNHPQIFDGARLATKRYPYFDPQAPGLDFDAMTAVLEQVDEGDAVLLHGCCHNPTGIDPSPEQWSRIGAVLARRKALPLVDFAYQGFLRGLAPDTEWLSILCGHVSEIAVCSSYSKNFGLYNERVGALTVIAGSPEERQAVLSQVQRAARASYSNPPAHGAAIVTTILGDAGLRRQWEDELREMRERIRRMRRLFVAALDERGVRLHPSGNGFIARQNGMFSFSGLTEAQVEKLRRDAAIYMVSSGRINVAGMTEANMDRLCDAIAAVLSPVMVA